MIVSQQNTDYTMLFTEAYEYLRDLDKGYVDENKERFGSLAEYYYHMADFFETQKYKYVMLPIDEEPFKIDLNTRAIEIPQSFAKCASVQSDQLAETIIFVADRYFDYMDLATTNIYVQWTIPENRKLGTEAYNGATEIEMIDLESLPGKIKFAWPLNEKITAVPGVVKFSVRFFRLNKDSSNEYKLAYSLNTIEKEIVIKEALQPELNRKNIENPISDNLFKNAIVDNLYSDEGVIPPLKPTYEEPGSNITADTMIDVNGVKVVSLSDNTITLRAQAIVADAGDITYKWLHSRDEDEKVYYDCENYPNFDDDGNVIENSFITFGNIKDEYVLIEPTERIRNERYYEKVGENGYKLYTGTIPANIPLYERYTTFTVPNTGKITGYYRAEAFNNITVPNGYSKYRGTLTEEEFNNNIDEKFYEKDNGSYKVADFTFDSNKIYYVKRTLTTPIPAVTDSCLLPPPEEVVFKENGNLKNGMILMPEEEDDEQVFKATLSVDIIEDNYNSQISYEWRRSNLSEEQAIDLVNTEVYATTDVNSLEVTEPGWYSVNVISELNRTSKNKLSVNDNGEPMACKVTNFPNPPVVDAQSIGGAIIGYVKDEPATFRVKASINNPDNVVEDLLSDNISYVWQISHVDTNDSYINIPDDFPGITGLGTNAITVTGKKLPVNVANFRCLVINELNEAKAIFDHSGSYVSNGTLGDFKAEPPYIYEDDTLNYIFTAVNL